VTEKILASGNSWALVEELVDFGLTRTVLKLRSKYGTVELSTKGQSIVFNILNDIKSEMAKALSYLDERERQVLALRYGIGEEVDEHTLSEIGAQLGVTRERVRQIEVRALEKLRERLTRRRSCPRQRCATWWMVFLCASSRVAATGWPTAGRVGSWYAAISASRIRADGMRLSRKAR